METEDENNLADERRTPDSQFNNLASCGDRPIEIGFRSQHRFAEGICAVGYRCRLFWCKTPERKVKGQAPLSEGMREIEKDFALWLK
jgi:hypothetical protein